MNAVSKRPTPKERRQLILDAAADVFFETGYAASSIDQVIARIGGSKRNIYNEFGSKEGLFTALVLANSDRAVSALELGEVEGRTLKEILMQFGLRLSMVYMSRTQIGTYRVIVSEGQRFPDLAREFYSKGPGRAISRLTQVFEDAHAQGEAYIGDCRNAANHFVSMLRDNVHLEVLLGLRQPLSEAEAQISVAAAVEVFWNGVCKR